MKKKRSIGAKILRVLLFILGGFLALLLMLVIYVVSVARMDPPEIADESALKEQRTALDSSAYVLRNNWFRKSKTGLYEMYVEGKPFDRGVAYGKLTSELVKRQEDHFSEQINRMIPSPFYLRFLKYFVGWFNRDLDKHVPEEYKEEIYGISFEASSHYGYIGTNYERLMNYHAAHDIGHALQSMALVGCTSFATWNSRSADSSLIVGRNFDFYVGDKFAEDKIVAFYKPSEGHKFMIVTWAGFVGCVSGMNDQGLTVTINADKTSIPSGSATPVSLVAREILQYAGNIKEAWAIAQRRKMFVSESFLIGSAADNKAVIIEKTPESMDLYEPDSKADFITCTNHFQGDTLKKLASNKEQEARSASVYRYNRLMELLQEKGPNTVQKSVDILRDRFGMHNADIGVGNEKAINQFIAHHSIVFEPKQLKVWVSTQPWQLGQYAAYDLHTIFDMHGLQTDHEVYDSAASIGPDPFLQTDTFRLFQRYRAIRADIQNGKDIDVQELIHSNPTYYHTYVLAGDYAFKHKAFAAAKGYYEHALTLVIATKNEEDHIRAQLQKIEKQNK
ncbi:peptidase C45 [Chitinophaga parva]|uniref:Peptidase C45 n=1 Tax=Chitinophaga parva TaxID=2169414 RepID=A0A2T7BFT0_9BACT|nr:C45 family peptidase [Chitinophaga parva]PUZ25141.1 peptidase C45 [Chitinophaga parva]